MKSLFVVGSLVAIVLGVGTGAGPAEDDGPAKDVPELGALSHYIGTWDVAIHIDGNEYARGTATAKWVLGGRYVEQAGTLKPSDGSPEVHIKSLMTYDPMKGVYKTWAFASNAPPSISEGSWDARAHTMSSKSQPDANGFVSMVTTDFSEANVESWKVVVKDGEGRTVVEVQGKNTRKGK